MTRIFHNGETIRIKTAVAPSPQEKFAAEELCAYLERMTSTAVEQCDESYEGPVIAIGGVCGEYGVPVPEGDDAFTLKTVGESLCITGGKRGVIYGMYELLERLGCRFFTATCEKVPFVEELTIGDLDETQRPDFIYREHAYYEHRQYSRFALKSRLNGANHPIKDEWGGHIRYSWFVHSFQNIISPEEYGESHPEYFAMDENGERVLTRDKNQLCLSNPEILPIAIEAVRRNLLEHPEAEIISISQNDWRLDCQCPECRRINEADGASSGTLIRFVNAIAEALEREFPHVTFDTLAYQYTRSAPTVRPRHNVAVRLCSIECCFAHPFEDCCRDSNTTFVRDLRDWHKTGAQLYIWDYVTCFNYYPTPHPNWRSLQPNMRLFRENGVKGIFEQGCCAQRGSTDLNELRAYVLTKLMWNADADVDKLVEEFTDYYYGAAGKYIREYINLVCDTAVKEGDHTGFNDKPLHKYLEKEHLTQYDGLFIKAIDAVSEDTIRRYRVEKARLSIRYMRFYRDFFENGEADRRELHDLFDEWESFGLGRMEEDADRTTTRKALLRGKPIGINLYWHWTFEGPEIL
ncbi:DUF4838 domain-containing protein [Acutalibacter sp. 1XD8-36]|uniref:DUF4838 domain-containing protein n=1 Tax=Acutalibacter sp. 1XD8-36 TaxID=2320852 RepID=UPI002616A920|nr:DUF4838 domain-containing protein [Acutalibacter sp. 1XD8-36]